MINENKPSQAHYVDGSSRSNSNDDELGLIDIIHQLWQGKKIILYTILVFLIFAIAYVFLVKEKWTSEAIITQPTAGQVATYNNALSILYSQNIADKISLPDLQRQIFGRYSTSAYALSGILENLDQPLEFIVTQAVKGRDDTLNIKFTGQTAKEAQQQLQHYMTQLNTEVSDDFAIDLRNNIFVKKEGLKDSIAAQEKIAQDKKQHRLDVISQALKIADAAKLKNTQLSQAEFLSDDTLYLLGSSALNSMIENEKTKPLELNDFYYQTQRALFALNALRLDFTKMQNFEFIKKPDMPLRRDSPKRVKILALSAIIGGVIGSLLVIFQNIVQSYNRRKAL